MLRHGTFTEAQFRQQVLDVCTSGEEHMVVSYSRRSFQQTGDGHFSPVGGYHRGRDLVLILDVARFKYPPHWVPLSLLYEAMSSLDPVTGMPRGYLLMTSHQLLDSAMFTLDVRQVRIPYLFYGVDVQNNVLFLRSLLFIPIISNAFIRFRGLGTMQGPTPVRSHQGF
jgi:hypothetical protein